MENLGGGGGGGGGSSLTSCESWPFVNRCPWWRHQMKTFCTLLANCAGNSPDSPSRPFWRQCNDCHCPICNRQRVGRRVKFQTSPQTGVRGDRPSFPLLTVNVANSSWDICSLVKLPKLPSCSRRVHPCVWLQEGSRYTQELSLVLGGDFGKLARILGEVDKGAEGPQHINRTGISFCLIPEISRQMVIRHSPWQILPTFAPDRLRHVYKQKFSILKHSSSSMLWYPSVPLIILSSVLLMYA